MFNTYLMFVMENEKKKKKKCMLQVEKEKFRSI